MAGSVANCRRKQLDGHYWARTSDLRLVEAALSQLSYTPGGEKVSSGPGVPGGAQATGAVGAWTAPAPPSSTPLARIVILNVSSVSYFGVQSVSAFSFSVETTHG